MSVSITGKLNKAASEFQAGESVGFGLRLGQQYYDRDTKQKEWTNYECAIFAKAPAQIEFYRQSLVEGSVVEILGKRQKIRTFEGNNGTVLSIEIVDASLESVNTLSGGQSAPASQPAPKPQPQSFGGDGQGGFNTAPAVSADPWAKYESSGKAEGKPVDSVKNHPSIAGDIQKALSQGLIVEKKSTPSFEGFDSSIPF